MKLLIGGLSPRDGAAIELFLRREHPDWTWALLPADRQAAWPRADALILDLAAYGWAQASAEHAAQLQQRLGPQPAILLVSAQDPSWADLRQRVATPRWVWLGKPYNAAAMHDALSALTHIVRQPPAAPVVVAPATLARTPHADPSSAAASTTTPPTAVPAQTTVSPTTSKQNRPLARINAVQIASDFEANPGQSRCAELLARLTAGGDRHRLLRHVAEGCASRTAFELRFTLNHCVVVHPTQGWAASNTPQAVVVQVARSDTLARSVAVRALSDAEAAARISQLGLARLPLADWLADLLPTLPPASA